MTEIKYKEEIARIQRGANTSKPITFAVDAKRLNPRTEDAPLMFYNDYARFVFTILNKGGNRLRAQIKPKEVSLLSKKLQYCINRILDAGIPSSSSTAEKAAPVSSKVSTVKIAMKGAKTVAQLLADDIKNEDLEYVRNILEQNLSKYPRNQDQIDAINEGLEMRNSGNTRDLSTANAGIVHLYKSEYRYMTGLESNTRNNYTLTIECDINEAIANRPAFKFNIVNQIVKFENGVAGTEAIKTMNQYFNCTLEEFDDIVESMLRTMKWFEMYSCMPIAKLYYTGYNASAASNQSNDTSNTRNQTANSEPEFR